jgi:hypothetical protein
MEDVMVAVVKVPSGNTALYTIKKIVTDEKGFVQDIIELDVTYPNIVYNIKGDALAFLKHNYGSYDIIEDVVDQLKFVHYKYNNLPMRITNIITQ